MRVALGAYRLMELVAESHGGIDDVEARVLASYRKALGLDGHDLDELHAADPAALVIEGDDREREETVRAMARVAAADGLFSARERGYLLEVAERLGIGRVRAANLITAETAARPAANPGRPRVLLLAAVVLAPLAFWFTWGRAADNPLQEVAQGSDHALVLIQVDYTFERGDRRKTYQGEGTGFFVDGGLIVTCKHVVQPWKFLADKRKLRDEGWELEVETIRWRAYGVGTQLAKDGAPWDTQQGTLHLELMAKDDWVRATRGLPDGGEHTATYHALGNTDLVLLRAKGEVPPGLPLASPDHEPATLDEVVVMGFPKGASLLEGSRALSAPSTGVVRRVEDTILISSDTFPGNSGGPCLDRNGEVIGVVARRAGDKSLGRCLRTAHVWALLEELPR